MRKRSRIALGWAAAFAALMALLGLGEHWRNPGTELMFALFGSLVLLLAGLGVVAVIRLSGPIMRGSVFPRKRCPMCAEDVYADALVCRYCGHGFGDGAGPSSSLK